MEKWSLPAVVYIAVKATSIGALRELYEETGLKLKTSDINELVSENFRLAYKSKTPLFFGKR